MRNTTIVADIGSNHNCNIHTAMNLIEEAAKAGADVVKFQLFQADKIAHRSSPSYEQLKENELPREWCERLQLVARKNGVEWTATPFDLDAVDLLQRLDVPFIKIASGDLTYHRLIEKAALTGKPLVISTGAGTEEEIQKAEKLIIKAAFMRMQKTYRVTWLHCIVEYPCPVKNTMLQRIKKLDKENSGNVGLSDHTLSTTLPAVAVGLGATMIEKHITLNRNQAGADHGHSLEPHEFQQMVDAVRETELALSAEVDGYVPSEKKMRTVARRGLYWARDIKDGCVVKLEDIIELRPCSGDFGAEHIGNVVGKKLLKPVDSGKPVRTCDIV